MQNKCFQATLIAACLWQGFSEEVRGFEFVNDTPYMAQSFVTVTFRAPGGETDSELGALANAVGEAKPGRVARLI